MEPSTLDLFWDSSSHVAVSSYSASPGTPTWPRPPLQQLRDAGLATVSQLELGLPSWRGPTVPCRTDSPCVPFRRSCPLCSSARRRLALSFVHALAYGVL